MSLYNERPLENQNPTHISNENQDPNITPSKKEGVKNDVIKPEIVDKSLSETKENFDVQKPAKSLKSLIKNIAHTGASHPNDNKSLLVTSSKISTKFSKKDAKNTPEETKIKKHLDIKTHEKKIIQLRSEAMPAFKYLLPEGKDFTSTISFIQCKTLYEKHDLKPLVEYMKKDENAEYKYETFEYMAALQEIEHFSKDASPNQIITKYELLIKKLVGQSSDKGVENIALRINVNKTKLDTYHQHIEKAIENLKVLRDSKGPEQEIDKKCRQVVNETNLELLKLIPGAGMFDGFSVKFVSYLKNTPEWNG